MTMLLFGLSCFTGQCMGLDTGMWCCNALFLQGPELVGKLL